MSDSDETAKSPVFSHVNATLDGLATIRSGGPAVLAMMKRQFDDYQNINTGADYIMRATATTFCLFVDVSCSVFVACVTLIAIWTKTGNSRSRIIERYTNQ